jgi:pimeloyl-ACP methyl ester carboxylesterase
MARHYVARHLISAWGLCRARIWRYHRAMLSRSTPVLCTVLCGLLLSACASGPSPDQATQEKVRAAAEAYIATADIHDDRGRFAEIYCAVLEARRDAVPDWRSCEEALRLSGQENGASGEPVALGRNQSDLLALFVPGLGWNCFESFLDIAYSVPTHVAQFGYELRMIPIDGLSSSANNARMIRDFVAALPEEDADRPLVLMGYSKGAPDILEAVVAYPELAERVAAVVSIAGAVHGSPLADDATQAQANMLTIVPGSECEEEDGDNDAIASLRTDVRQQWLEDNTLPGNIRFFSLVTFPEEDRVSWGLRNSWILLGQKDIRNDTQVIAFDQIIPASTLLALVNADHWAIAVAVARTHPLIGGTAINRNDYPREALTEALLRYLDETL